MPKGYRKNKRDYSAMFKEGGNGASIRTINPYDNRGAGSTFGYKLRPYPNGTKIKYKITDD